MIAFVCGLCMAETKEDVQNYYDNSSVECIVALPEKVRGDEFLWELSTPRWRIMSRGQVSRKPGENFVKVPLKFDTLKPGISLRCVLTVKKDGIVAAEQKIVIYSRKIFKNVAGRLKRIGIGAVLPQNEIAALNALGLELPEKPSDNLGDPAYKIIFCAAKKYLDNVDILSDLMKRGRTLIMFAPDDESEILLPLKDFSEISFISAKNVKTEGSLGIVCNKEKIAVSCSNGEGGFIKIKYEKGNIIIIADSVYKTLGEIPDAALLLKENLK